MWRRLPLYERKRVAIELGFWDPRTPMTRGNHKTVLEYVGVKGGDSIRLLMIQASIAYHQRALWQAKIAVDRHEQNLRMLGVAGEEIRKRRPGARPNKIQRKFKLERAGDAPAEG